MNSSCFIVILLCYYCVFLCFRDFTLIGAPIEKRSEKGLKTLKFSILCLWPTPWRAPQTKPWRVQVQLPQLPRFPTSSTKAPHFVLVAGAIALWRAPQEGNGFLYFQVEGHPSQFHFFYLPINRNANSVLQSSKLRAEANSEATLFHLGIYSVFYSGNRFALECYHNCVIKFVIESVIEFGALWKEVNPAAIFFSALQFTQPSDWSRFLLLAFTLFISRTRF